jgi:hypothetical protein
MSFGRSASDYITILLTLVGIGLCFVWRRQGDVVHASEEPAAWWWRSGAPGGGGDPTVDQPWADELDELDDLDDPDVGEDVDDPDAGEHAEQGFVDQTGDTSDPTDPYR